ncbi:MAG: tetratricopeptide repeat protein [Sphingobacteriia bacterium]|nr:tetratricopeptide repeat protein [Sphingobacteriia bacterium]
MERINRLLEFHNADPTDTFILYALAMEYEKIENLEEAIKFYKLLSTKYPEYLATYYHYGKLLEKIGKTETAKVIYSNGINLSVEMKEHHTASELRQALNSLNDDNLF